jgi:hypothetical protein
MHPAAMPVQVHISICWTLRHLLRASCSHAALAGPLLHLCHLRQLIQLMRLPTAAADSHCCCCQLLLLLCCQVAYLALKSWLDDRQEKQDKEYRPLTTRCALLIADFGCLCTSDIVVLSGQSMKSSTGPSAPGARCTATTACYAPEVYLSEQCRAWEAGHGVQPLTTRGLTSTCVAISTCHAPNM